MRITPFAVADPLLEAYKRMPSYNHVLIKNNIITVSLCTAWDWLYKPMIDLLIVCHNPKEFSVLYMV